MDYTETTKGSFPKTKETLESALNSLESLKELSRIVLNELSVLLLKFYLKEPPANMLNKALDKNVETMPELFSILIQETQINLNDMRNEIDRISDMVSIEREIKGC